eukprot:1220592-Pleurochrysis_carterae.AAC.1
MLAESSLTCAPHASDAHAPAHSAHVDARHNVVLSAFPPAVLHQAAPDQSICCLFRPKQHPHCES